MSVCTGILVSTERPVPSLKNGPRGTISHKLKFDTGSYQFEDGYQYQVPARHGHCHLGTPSVCDQSHHTCSRSWFQRWGNPEHQHTNSLMRLCDKDI